MARDYEPEFTVTNPQGVVFNVRILRQGEKYGLNDCLTHRDADPVVEFYVANLKSQGWPRGQLASSYYVKDFLQIAGGLCLFGDVREWDFSEVEVCEVKEYLRENLSQVLRFQCSAALDDRRRNHGHHHHRPPRNR